MLLMPHNSSRTPSKIALEIALSVTTLPVLFGLLAGKELTKLLQEAGLISEELFRGDRLPTLNLRAPKS
jgi:hypothetical protein